MAGRQPWALARAGRRKGEETASGCPAKVRARHSRRTGRRKRMQEVGSALGGAGVRRQWQEWRTRRRVKAGLELGWGKENLTLRPSSPGRGLQAPQQWPDRPVCIHQWPGPLPCTGGGGHACVLWPGSWSAGRTPVWLNRDGLGPLSEKPTPRKVRPPTRRGGRQRGVLVRGLGAQTAG